MNFEKTFDQLKTFAAWLVCASIWVGFWFKPMWSLAGLGRLIFGGAIFNQFVSPLLKKRAERRAIAERKLMKCAHGVMSLGENCVQCRADAERAARLRKIQRDATELSGKELERLRAAWRQKGVSFLKMPWQQFEDEIAVCFSKLGYEVIQTSRTNDGGFDGRIKINDVTSLYECKSGNQNIGRPDIQKFHSALVSEGAFHGFFFNTGRFSQEAEEYARKTKIITLIDRGFLVKWVATAYPEEIDSTSLSLICTSCGETVRVVGLPTEARCSAGHVIQNGITQADIEKHTVFESKSRRRKYRRRNWRR